MVLTANFVLEEFNCNDGTPVPERLIPNVQRLASNLQIIRNEIGEPLRVISGYRTPEWNARVGGEKNSYHLKAMAADLTCKSLSPLQLKSVILKLIKRKLIINGGLGTYKGFIHYDVRPYAARWNG